MSEFPNLVRRIQDLWQFLWEIEELLFLDKSKKPEEASEKIKREIKKLQNYARSLSKHD